MKKMRCPAIFHNTDGTYTLDSKYTAVTLIRGWNIQTDSCTLLPNGNLVLNRGFIWDGPSGGAIDTANTMMPSAMHDCLYGLITAGELPKEARKLADKSYRDALKTWRVARWRRMLHFRGLSLLGWTHI